MIREFCVIQGFPAPIDIAPYIYVLLEDTGAKLNGAYRGKDAEHLLLAHGRYLQDDAFGASDEERAERNIMTSLNPSGASTHELFSDGEVYPYVKRGDPLQWWQMGFGVDLKYSDAMVRAGAERGWKLFQPYPGLFKDHLNFVEPPQVWHTDLMERILNLRETLPRS